MDFNLTPEQSQIRDMARDFALGELEPVASEYERNSRFPIENLRKMANLGLFGMLVPEELGGSATGAVAYSLAVTEGARCCASTCVTMSVTNMVAEAVHKFGTDAQKRRFLPMLFGGDFPIGAFALTEPQAGSDARAIRTRAVRQGDSWVLTGSKAFITSGAFASIVIVYAVTENPEGGKGISAFVVERGTPGLIVGKEESKMGLRASNTVALSFEDCSIPADNLLGEVGGGFRIAMTALDGGRVGVSSQALGIATRALEEAVRYSKERIQFGKPISELQAIQWMLADSATELDAARLLVLRAATLKEKGIRSTAEASMAKLYATEAANRICARALQVHGGYGYVTEYIPERLLRDCKVTTIYEGTSEIQRIVIARSVLG